MLFSENIQKIISSLGGKSNILDLDSCYTRLIVKLLNNDIVNRETLLKNGAKEVFFKNDGVQIVFGINSKIIKDEILITNENKSIIKDNLNEILSLKSPCRGRLINICDVDDDVFSRKLAGDGFAIFPDSNNVYSPVNGRVKSIFDSKHAIVIETDFGKDILVHIGINTVHLKGEGLDLYISENDVIKEGDLMAKLDLNFFKSKGISPVTMVLITDTECIEDMDYTEKLIVNKNDLVIKIKFKEEFLNGKNFKN